MLDQTRPDHSQFLPRQLANLENPQTDIPRLAKDTRLLEQIEAAIQQIPTEHRILQADSRNLSFLQNRSIHLVLTSPPYWKLKKYNDHPHQLGNVDDYDQFLDQLDQVWKHCFQALVPGGRVVCVVGDVCLSRRQNHGRHTVVPLHASIQERIRKIGFDNLAPIIWHKITNAQHESKGNGGGFLGKPYEPNSVIKNDVEYILSFRKPGGYRSPFVPTRVLSIISDDNHKQWFRSIWSDVPGASTRNHPAPYSEELAVRLIRMFSFVGDTVLDPFLGTGTTTIAAARWGRNSVGIELDADYVAHANTRINQATASLFSKAKATFDPKKNSYELL